jgi:hypothetical protein
VELEAGLDALQAFACGQRDGLGAALLAREPALVAALQARLSRAGLLDPPSSSLLDPETQWALKAFCDIMRLPFKGALSRAAAEALLVPESAPPLQPQDDLAGRVAAALMRRGDWICRHPDCVNIAYVEGLNAAGLRIPRRPDAFDDLRLLLRIAEGGKPELCGAWTATTAPGRPAVEAPAEPVGAPVVRRGQYRAWVLGYTAIGTPFEQEALVQVEPLAVTRDQNRNFQREGDPAEDGLFLIDQHGGLDAAEDRVGGSGAGCLVGRAQAGHRDFMAMLRRDPRWRMNTSHRFTTSILGAEELGD